MHRITPHQHTIIPTHTIPPPHHHREPHRCAGILTSLQQQQTASGAAWNPLVGKEEQRKNKSQTKPKPIWQYCFCFASKATNSTVPDVPLYSHASTHTHAASRAHTNPIACLHGCVRWCYRLFSFTGDPFHSPFNVHSTANTIATDRHISSVAEVKRFSNSFHLVDFVLFLLSFVLVFNYCLRCFFLIPIKLHGQFVRQPIVDLTVIIKRWIKCSRCWTERENKKKHGWIGPNVCMYQCIFN